jgi:hypothetical protein
VSCDGCIGLQAKSVSRHGSVKRVASAVGEGFIALQMGHEYLVRLHEDRRVGESEMVRRCRSELDDRIARSVCPYSSNTGAPADMSLASGSVTVILAESRRSDLGRHKGLLPVLATERIPIASWKHYAASVSLRSVACSPSFTRRVAPRNTLRAMSGPKSAVGAFSMWKTSRNVRRTPRSCKESASTRSM